MAHIGIDLQPVAEQRTGVGQATWHLLKALAEVDRTNRYTLFLFDFRRRFRDASLAAANMRIKKLRLPGAAVHKSWDLFGAPTIERLVGPCDLYHFPNYLLPLLGSGTRALATLHDVSFIRRPGDTQPGNLRRLRKHLQQSVSRASGIVTVSRFSRDEILQCLDVEPHRVHIVYQGVANRFGPEIPPHVLEEVRQRYHLPERYLLFVGTLEPRKNLPNLIRAFGARKTFFQRETCKLVLAGMKGWQYREIYQAIEAQGLAGDVLFPGYVHDAHLPALYRGARLFVSPSCYEGFSMPPLEAMATGLPVIASDIAAHREVLGDAAVYFDPEDVDALADRMRQLYEDDADRTRLARQGLERAAAFRWEHSARAMLEIYEQYTCDTREGSAR